MFTTREVEAHGFTQVKECAAKSKRGESGNTEWGKDVFTGQKDGCWYEITIDWVDNGYKFHESRDDWEEGEITEEEAMNLRT